MKGEAWEALDRLRAAVRAIPPHPALPARPESARLVERLGAGAVAAKPAEATLDALQRHLFDAYRNGRQGQIDSRDLRSAPWVLWTPPTPTIILPGLLERVVAIAEKSRRCLLNLIEAWLQFFESGAPGIFEAGAAIRRLVRKSSDARVAVWRRADERFDLFSPQEGPRKVAAALARESGVPEVLEAAGLHHPLRATSGYLRAVQHDLLAAAATTLRGQRGNERLATIIAFLAPEPGRLRFRDTGGAVARGLLTPWLDGGQVPAAAVQDTVRDFLIATLGDPRLNAGAWTAAGNDVTALMRRWLARVSLKVFFRLVAEHADDKHWRYREAFWSSYLKHDAISDSWLALGQRVYNSARSMEELKGAYGQLNGTLSTHSVLLLRVGNLVIAEYSHNGSLRIWPADWRDAPQLGRESYQRSQIVKNCLPFPPSRKTGAGTASPSGLAHFGSEQGHWQSRAAELIERHTLVRIPEEDWMP